MTGAPAGVEPILTSARTGLGIREIWSHLDQVLVQVKGKGRARPA